MTTTDELRLQWANPGDILSLLLLIGGNIIQKAIAQLIGHRISLPGARHLALPIAPVAFSFGWVAYSFTNLLAAVGDTRLMPMTDYPAVVVNCSNGFVRESRSWVLGRLFRDYEISHPIDVRPEAEGGRAESIRIDVFCLGPASTATYDFIWWSGLVTLLIQLGIAVAPWVLYGDWGIMLVTLVGILLVAVTCAMPQWIDEKWAGRTLERQKVTCLTRGNGHFHVMVLIGMPGSWDLESLAAGASRSRPETRWMSLVLTILWTCLLISISGLTHHTWFLVGIGGLGMLQNVLAAGAPRSPGASNFHLTAFSRCPTIIGRRRKYQDDQNADVDFQDALQELVDMDLWASERPSTQQPIKSTEMCPPATIPPWLNTMSREDDVPTWLESSEPANVSRLPPLAYLIPYMVLLITAKGSCSICYWSSRRVD